MKEVVHQLHFMDIEVEMLVEAFLPFSKDPEKGFYHMEIVIMKLVM